jgi:hypothetical protein
LYSSLATERLTTRNKYLVTGIISYTAVLREKPEGEKPIHKYFRATKKGEQNRDIHLSRTRS